MRTHALAPAVALGILTAGCIDVLEPEPPREDPVVDVRLAAGQDEDVLEVYGSLYPGLTPAGTPGRVDDPFLRLAGVALAPDTVVGSDHVPWIVWQGSVALAPPPPDSVRVSVPRVEDRSPGDLALWLLRPLDGTTLPLPGPGEDLVLRLAPRAPDAPRPVRESWTLRIDAWRDGELIPVTLSASTPVPDSIRVPAAWLGAEPLDSLEAMLDETRLFDAASADGRYRLRGYAGQVLRWRAKAAAPGPL